MAPHRVAVLALDRVVPFDLGIPARVFGAAARDDGHPLYEVLTCSIGDRAVTTNAGFAIIVSHDERALYDADTVVIATQQPAGRVRREGVLDPEVAATLARIPPSTRLVSICTGAFVLAAAGLLDGRPATTHWKEAALLQRLFPRVSVNRDVLFVDDGRVLTSAGAAAGVDLCLHVVRLIRRAHRSRQAFDELDHRAAATRQPLHPQLAESRSSVAATTPLTCTSKAAQVLTCAMSAPHDWGPRRGPILDGQPAHLMRGCRPSHPTRTGPPLRTTVHTV